MKLKESEFKKLVEYIMNIDDKVKSLTGAKAENPFVNLTPVNIIGSLLRLLDARRLTKELQIAGLSILRKIIEMVNESQSSPSADWNTQDWSDYQRIIVKK